MDTEPAGPRVREITEQQQRFVREYVLDRNATQAAIRAGYTPRNARQTGSRLKCHARVGAAIRELLGDSPPARSRPGLTPKQQRFVVEYAVDHNATQAAVRAGYSPRYAHPIGSRLKRHKRVGAAIRERLGDAPDAWRRDPTPLQQRLALEY
ncbi:MAG TPA: terminase small subunit, partial [Beijerinckiaceae bacterium]|nr:terminase small subunit [Beijerinckiaceae bacterium]